MVKKLGALATVIAVATLGLLLTAQPASADGAVVVGMPNAVATSNGGTVATCTASGFANWSVDPEVGSAIIFGGGTNCDRAMPMSGTAEIIPNGGSAAVASR